MLYGLLPDSPTRVGAPPRELAAPAFGELPLDRQLEIAEGVCRRDPYMSALEEALPESPRYRAFLHMALERAISNEELGALTREIVLGHLQAVAIVHGDDLAEIG